MFLTLSFIEKGTCRKMVFLLGFIEWSLSIFFQEGKMMSLKARIGRLASAEHLVIVSMIRNELLDSYLPKYLNDLSLAFKNSEISYEKRQIKISVLEILANLAPVTFLKWMRENSRMERDRNYRNLYLKLQVIEERLRKELQPHLPGMEDVHG
jgi:hypothetical protein